MVNHDAVSRAGGHRDVHVIILRGEVDMAREDELAALQADFERSTAPDAEVDLTDVTFMASTGLNFLVRIKKQASARDGTVTLVGVSPRTARLLTICGLDDMFDLGASEAPASG